MIITFLFIWIGVLFALYFWIIVGPRIQYHLGRRWAVTLYDIDIEVRKRYRSIQRATAEAKSRNLARIHFGMNPDWGVKEITTYHEYIHGSEEEL
jgi:hypothetical protein